MVVMMRRPLNAFRAWWMNERGFRFIGVDRLD